MKLELEPIEKSGNIYVWGLIFFAFLFCVAVRLTWVYHFSGVEEFKWNNEFMVVTNDSYYFAEGARDLVYCQKDNTSMGEFYQKNCHQEFDLSPVFSPLSKITYVLYNILPFSFETIIFYLPALFSSLVVIPIILLCRRLHMTTVGLIAALLMGIGCSYYNRNMVGYYDTDMFNIIFPLLIIYALALCLKTQEKKYILIFGLSLVVFRTWYPQGYSIELVFLGLTFLYALLDIFKFNGNKTFYYQLFFVAFLSLSNFDGLIGLGIVILAYILICFDRFKPFILYATLLTLAIFLIYLFTEGARPVWGLLKAYVFRDSHLAFNDEVKLYFMPVVQTIVEASGASGSFSDKFTPFAQRISIYPTVFILSMIGYIWLCIKKPVFLLLLPILGLGFLSFSKGIRFAMYAIPAASFGMAYLIVRSSEILRTFIDKKFASYFAMSYIVIFTAFVIYPVIAHANGYKVSTVFNKSEVTLLDNLGKEIDREDYVVSWWDYGYPIRYYADSKTLIDGAKHDGTENFPVSFILGADQESAARLARLDVEYTENRFLHDKKNSNLSKKDGEIIPSNNIAWMMKDYNYINSNDFLLSLQTDIDLPKKTRDIYFYLPFRMLDIFPTILRFSNRDLMSGNEFRSPVFIITRNAQDLGNSIALDYGYSINKQGGTLVMPDKTTSPLKRFVIANFQQNGDQIIHNNEVQNLHYNGQYSIIYLPAYNRYLLLDDKMYNSVYVQLFYLGNYNKELFELVSSNVYAKIYKLKI